MTYKLCPNCREMSYSPYPLEQWRCPYCGKDISFVTTLTAEARAQQDSVNVAQGGYYLRLLPGKR